jgi:hypothetical protein
MLFDHGCDAFTTCVIAIAVCRVAGVSLFLTSFVACACGFLFLMVTLEQ